MNYRLLIVFSVFIGHSLFSQPYQPLLEEGNVWSVDIYFEPFDPPSPPYSWTETWQITLGDIEIIDGRSYYRMSTDQQPTCLLREENGIVYKYEPTLNMDSILFDFNLEVGDTFNLIGSAYDSWDSNCSGLMQFLYETDLHVQQVDYLELAGELRKVITFQEWNNYQQLQWIEGIGNISGFDLIWEMMDITSGSMLVCFTDNATTYFFNDATSCDNTTLGLDDIFISQIILYPNPVTNISYLRFPENTTKNLVKIFDINGSLIKQQSTNNGYILIKNSDYSSGIYFYQVYSNEKPIKTEKIIIK